MSIATKFKVILVSSCLILSGCPANVSVFLHNESDSTISIYYSPTFTSFISQGEVKKERFTSDCLRIEKDGTLFEFSLADIPSEFFREKITSSSIHARFTSQNSIEMFTEDSTGSEVHVLREGCFER